MTISPCRARGRRRRVAASTLALAALGVPAVALAETIALSGTEGPDRFTLTYDAPDRLRVAQNGQETAARQVAPGAVVDLVTTGGDDRVAVDAAEGLAADVGTRIALGDGDDLSTAGLRSGSSALEVDGALGDDVNSIHTYGDANRVLAGGGAGHDILGIHTYGDANRLQLDGGAGDDSLRIHTYGDANRLQLDGGAGDDSLHLLGDRTGQPATLRADLGGGGDRARGRGTMRAAYLGGDGDDDLRHFGSARPLSLDGGAGDDVLVARASSDDRLTGGPGNDRIVATGGGRDTVRCGRGRDLVAAERGDVVAADCERTVRYIDLNNPDTR